MDTTTGPYEEDFFTQFEEILARDYPELEMRAPPPGARFGAPAPELEVESLATGTRLALVVRAGFQASHLPIALLAYVRAVRDELQSEDRGGCRLALVTTGRIPAIVQGGLSRDGIPYFHVASPEEAAERVRLLLRATTERPAA